MLGAKDTRMEPDLSTKTSQPSYILVDSIKDIQTWDLLEGYEDVFAIAIGERTPLDAHKLDVTEDDVTMLLNRASALLADTERYKDVAEIAGVRFFKVE